MDQPPPEVASDKKSWHLTEKIWGDENLSFFAPRFSPKRRLWFVRDPVSSTSKFSQERKKITNSITSVWPWPHSTLVFAPIQRYLNIFSPNQTDTHTQSNYLLSQRFPDATRWAGRFSIIDNAKSCPGHWGIGRASNFLSMIYYRKAWLLIVLTMSTRKNVFPSWIHFRIVQFWAQQKTKQYSTSLIEHLLTAPRSARQRLNFYCLGTWRVLKAETGSWCWQI